MKFQLKWSKMELNHLLRICVCVENRTLYIPNNTDKFVTVNYSVFSPSHRPPLPLLHYISGKPPLIKEFRDTKK